MNSSPSATATIEFDKPLHQDVLIARSTDRLWVYDAKQRSNDLTKGGDGCLVMHSNLLDEVVNLVAAPVPMLGLQSRQLLLLCLSFKFYTIRFIFIASSFHHHSFIQQGEIEAFKFNFKKHMVNYINENATSTLVGDLAAVNSANKEFKNTAEIKMNATRIRHCLGASGDLEVIVAAKAMQTGWHYSSINQFNPEPAVEFDIIANIKQ